HRQAHGGRARRPHRRRLAGHGRHHHKHRVAARMKPAILVVDDERTICIAVERLLVARGYAVDTALSGEEAVEKLGQSTYRLLITDLTLTHLSGMDLLRWVKQHTPQTAVIMITAYGSEKIAVEAMKLGAVDYLPKPFDNDELELIVERALEAISLRRDL